MSAYVVMVEGLEELQDLENLPQQVALAAQRAINKIVDRSKAESARQIRKKVNFPARYVTGEKGRLSITKKASANSLEAVIRGRERPTSLAQFASNKAIGQAGVFVEVTPGKNVKMKKAFLLRLPQGSTLTDTQYNLGLAVRLRDGERVLNKKHMISMGKGLYLLYGPSVSQVFADVAEEQAPVAAAALEREFFRLMELP